MIPRAQCHILELPDRTCVCVAEESEKTINVTFEFSRRDTDFDGRKFGQWIAEVDEAYYHDPRPITCGNYIKPGSDAEFAIKTRNVSLLGTLLAMGEDVAQRRRASWERF